jgi:TolB-like protein/class 3 adenylate cyclase
MAATRRLAAILAADVAGYSRLTGADEEGTLERLKALRRELLDPKIAEHRGRIVKTTGDGLLVEFASVVDAVRCAVAVQQAMPERDAGVAADNRIGLRIGINLGDVIVEGDDLYGDGVNIAARIEAMADAGGVFVSNTVHDHVRDRLPFAFEDLGEQQVKNITRPVRVYRVGDTAAKAPPQPVLPLPDKPSIAVLPFVNMNGDPEQEYFADGMVEEIITALSRIRWLFVIARNSSFTYKGHAGDVKQVGRELGVRYVLEGSVRKAGGRVRITAQLIDAANGAHLWADRFDGSLEDVFEFQDKVAISVAGIIEPTLEAAEIRRSTERPTNDLSAYDLYLRALPYVATYQWDPVVRGLDLLRQAIERDPSFATALARAAYCHATLDAIGRVPDREGNRRTAIDFAHRALRAAADDALALAGVAHVFGYFNEDIDAAIAIIDRSLALNPSSAYGWRWSGFLRLYAGKPDLAIEHFETSVRLNPRDLHWVQLTGIAIAHFLAVGWRMRLRRSYWRSRRIRLIRWPTDFWFPAMPIWGGLMKRARSWRGFGRSRRSLYQKRLTIATRCTASCCCRACVWRLATRHEPDPPACCDPRRRCGGVFAADGGGRGIRYPLFGAVRHRPENRWIYRKVLLPFRIVRDNALLTAPRG